jgi:Cu/Zn superoxide dismutase
VRLTISFALAALAVFLVFGSTASADGVSGTATITKTADGYSEVVVQVSGLEPNTEHMNHIHVGPSCDSPGEHLISLENLVADGKGNATATTQARQDDAGQPVLFDSVTNGSRVLVIHRGPNSDTEENKEHLACGTIPASNSAYEVQATIEAHMDNGTHDMLPSTGTGPTATDNASLSIALASGLAILGLASMGLALAKRPTRK